MFGELPKLLDRDFALGFFLPTALFLAAQLGLLELFSLLKTFAPQASRSMLVGTTLVGLGSWILAVVLLALNRPIYQLLEGYGSANPFRLVRFWQVKAFCSLTTSIDQFDREYADADSCSQPFSDEKSALVDQLAYRLVSEFPDQESLVLPTHFGNVIRAFEVYPRVLYGLDAIPGWNRLLGVMSDSFRKQVDAGKALTDFWVNSCCFSLIIAAEYVVLASTQGAYRCIWILALALAISWVTSICAVNAATEWGEMVKAAFDLFLPDLRKKLEYRQPSTASKERVLWEKYTQAILYRRSDLLLDRTKQSSK